MLTAAGCLHSAAPRMRAAAAVRRPALRLRISAAAPQGSRLTVQRLQGQVPRRTPGAPRRGSDRVKATTCSRSATQMGSRKCGARASCINKRAASRAAAAAADELRPTLPARGSGASRLPGEAGRWRGLLPFPAGGEVRALRGWCSPAKWRAVSRRARRARAENERAPAPRGASCSGWRCAPGRLRRSPATPLSSQVGSAGFHQLRAVQVRDGAGVESQGFIFCFQGLSQTEPHAF